MDGHTPQTEVAAWWQRFELLPSRIERWFAVHWLLLFVVPVLVVAALERVTEDAIWVMRDPYVITLYASLLLSTCAFKWWQHSFRKTFGAALTRGFVPDDPASTAAYLEHSAKLEAWLKSAARFLPIVFFVAFAALLTSRDLPAAVSNGSVRSIYVVAYGTFLAWAYGVGAATWCLLACTYWIWKLPSSVGLVLVPGHPDRCGGVESIGRCCFRAVIPLLIGVTLACLWSLSRTVPFFRHYDSTWLALIVPTSTALMLVLASFSVALIVAPLRKLNELMSAENELRQDGYAGRIRKLHQDLRRAMHNGDSTQPILEELKLAGEMDPTKYPMGDWPFNYDVVLKYGSGPALSIATSLGKKALELLKNVG